MRRRLFIPFVLAGLNMLGQVTPEQSDSMAFFTATYQATLSASGTAFTLQVPPKSGKRVYPQYFIVRCSADCRFTQDRNGSAATGTSVEPVPLNTSGTPTAAFYQASDAGTGSALPALTIPANVDYPVDMKFTVFARGMATAQNHNWRLASPYTGTAQVSLVWGEK